MENKEHASNNVKYHKVPFSSGALIEEDKKYKELIDKKENDSNSEDKEKKEDQEIKENEKYIENKTTSDQKHKKIKIILTTLFVLLAIFLIYAKLFVLFVLLAISLIYAELFLLRDNLSDLRDYIDLFTKVDIENQYIPKIEIISKDGTSRTLSQQTVIPEDEEYSYYFTVEDGKQFKVLHLSDIHIKASKQATKRDKRALRAMVSMIMVEKPDLVIITGDINFSLGTNRNDIAPLIISEVMEKLGIYWAFAYGNHDNDNIMSNFSRKETSKILVDHSFIKSEKNHCLFISGPEDVYGSGNYAINIKNQNGKIVKTFFFIDSNCYHKVGWIKKYDRIHDDQIDWYKQYVLKLNLYNKKITNGTSNTPISSEMFFHIPIYQVKTAVLELKSAKGKNTTDAKYLFGEINEDPCVPEGFSEADNSRLFDTMLELKSTEALYFGHDHVNNAKILYKGILFSYAMAIDYNAYINMRNYGRYRGCALITYTLDNDVMDRNITNNWYYQDKYEVVEGLPYDREDLSWRILHRKYRKKYPDYFVDK